MPLDRTQRRYLAMRAELAHLYETRDDLADDLAASQLDRTIARLESELAAIVNG